MRIISCHIENFGKLSDQTFSFEKGCNIYLQENGWGKSTLSTFIRVMFFGFEEEKARDEYKNERRRYKPWQGGIYGGQLEFEVSGERYIISRTFGAKQKDDSFSLRESVTNLPSSRFSQNVGEELFWLDSHSFCRTVFVSQNDCETATTDGINAKIGNLAEDMDDINNYEDVDKRLADLLNKMSPRRVTGSLYKLKSECADLKERARVRQRIDQTIEEVADHLHQKEEEQKNLKKEQEALLKKQQKLGVYKELKGKREQYRQLCEEHQKREERVNQERAYFGERLPEPKDLKTCLDESAKLPALKENMGFYRLTEEEKQDYPYLEQLFALSCPSREELLDQEEKARTIGEIQLSIAGSGLSATEKERLFDYEEQFQEGLPTKGELEDITADWKRCLNKRDTLSQRRANLEILSTMSQSNAYEQGRRAQRKSLFGLIMELIAIGLAACLCLTYAPQYMGALAIAAGVLLVLTVGVIFWRLRKGNRPEGDRGEDTGEESELERLQWEIEEDEVFIQDMRQEMEDFLALYGMEYDDDKVLEQLYELKSDIREYISLQEKERAYRDADLEQKRQELQEEIAVFLFRYFPDGTPAEKVADRIYTLKEQARQYRHIKEKKENFDQAQGVYTEIIERLGHYLSSLGFEPKEELQTQFMEMQRHLQNLQTCLEEYEKAARQKEEFEAKEDVETIQNVEAPEGDESSDQVNDRLVQLASELEKGYEYLAEYQRKLQELQRESDQAAECEELLRVRQEEYQADTRKYELIQKTKDLLEQAKISFTAKYTQPIRESFGTYYELLASQSAEAYRMDANNHVTVEEQGMQREPQFFSTGYRNLIGICMRMALVEAMYQEEKPFLIFDDPFADLDGEKLAGARRFLEKIGEEYQVIYFTCHESRA
ncbi:MAG: hypothetical protein NC417_02285 [Candidatus Gastranaerophilales bacterium]|nr:hypothetical protein [Candidatus Gastranaerophilales bacterium]